jgi:hypothetical protein
MERRRLFWITRIALVVSLLANNPVSARADGLEGLMQFFKGSDEPLTLKDVAYLVDCLDEKLAQVGTIGVKSPDVWGQNRMTRYRAEFEGQMAQNLDQFQLILQGAQRRSDTAVLTSATSLAATVAAASPATSRGGSKPSAVVVPSSTATPSSGAAGSQPQNSITINTAGTGNSSSAGGASSSSAAAGSSSTAPAATDPTALLSDISAKLAALQSGLLPLPQNISNFVTKAGQTGVGLEPTIQLDEQQNYINHLHRLRRVNAGGDSTDMAGYGLYLLRMPITLMPGPDSRKGKGAIVTMEARHDLTGELLENTLRDVVVLDATYALTQVINEELHRHICMKCAPPKKTKKKKLEKYDLLLVAPELVNMNNFPSAGKELIVAAIVNHVLHLRIFDGDGKKVVDTDEWLLNAQSRVMPQNVRILKQRLGDLKSPYMPIGISKDTIIPAIIEFVGYQPPNEKGDVVQALPDIEGFPEDDCADDDDEDLLDDEQRSMVGGMKTGAGPNSVRLSDLRIILGSTCWPAPLGRAAGDDDGQDAQENKEDQKAEGNQPGKKVDPISLDTVKQNQTTARGSIRASDPDGVIRTNYQQPAVRAHRWSTSLPISLRGPNNRLRLLYNSINRAQQVPYRHDPSTLALLRGALLDAHYFIRSNVQNTPLFQTQRIDTIGRLYLQRNYKQLIQEREKFLEELVAWRNGYAPGIHPAPWDQDPDLWERQLTPTDVLAFVLMIQSYAVDRYLKDDIRQVATQKKVPCDDVEQCNFYDFQPGPPSQAAFIEHVERKWPIKVYSVDPVLNQQNILDAFSRRTELQLALAASVASGQISVKNATSYARQLDLDLTTVGLNRTAVGFGAGETTFGWMFYPRVQTPPSQSNPRRIASLLYWNGPPPNYDLSSRQIEPGQQECIALIVAPNFVPSIGLSTVANWFDITGHCAARDLSNREMLDYSHKLQIAQNSLTRICDSREYRKSDLTNLTQRVKQLSELLPTQDYRVDLPDEGDLLGSEIFSDNAAGLAPSLLAWYGEHPQEGQNSSIFLMGRGFSVAETQVVAGGVDVPDAQKRLISRNVMEIVIPANARIAKYKCPAEDDEDPHADHATTPASTTAAAKKKPCGWAVIDVHVATPNGISNHLYVEADTKPAAQAVKNVVLTATTTTAADPAHHQSTTSTRVETTPPGLALPPLTVLPLATQWPANTVMAQGSVSGAPPGSVYPGMVNPTAAAAPLPPPTLDPTATPSASVPSTPAPTAPAAPSLPPEAIPPPVPTVPTGPAQMPPAGTPAPTTSLPPLPSPTSLSRTTPQGGTGQVRLDEGIVPARVAADTRARSSIPRPRSYTTRVPAQQDVAIPAEPNRAVSKLPPLSLRSAPMSSARGAASPPKATARPVSQPPVASKPSPTKRPPRRSLRDRLGLTEH